MSSEHSDLQRRLNDLDADFHNLNLPGPDAARRRARQRSRRQVSGAVLGAVVVVAAGAFTLGGLADLTSSPPGPADTPTDEPSPEPTPDDGGLALTVDDLLASYDDPELAASIGWRLGDPVDVPITCAPPPGDADRVIQQWFRTVDDGSLEQIIEISSVDQAQARYQAVIDQLLACVEEQIDAAPDDTSFNLIWTVDGIGDATWLGEYYVAPRGPDGELTIVTVSVVLTGDTVTMLTNAGLGMHGHLAGPLPYEIPAAAAGRLCAAAGHECVDDPAPQRVHPPVNSETEPGWLTVEDVVTMAPDLGPVGEAGDVVDGDEWGHVCLQDVNPVAAGATGVPRRGYHDPVDETGEIPLYEFIAEFDSDQEARAHYLGLMSAMEQCGAAGDGGVVGLPDEWEGFAWRVADEFVTFHVGIVINGPRVAVFEFMRPTGDEFRLDLDHVHNLLGRAGERLGEFPDR